MASSHDSILTFLLVLAPPSSGADLGLTVKGQKKKKVYRHLTQSQHLNQSDFFPFLAYPSTNTTTGPPLLSHLPLPPRFSAAFCPPVLLSLLSHLSCFSLPPCNTNSSCSDSNEPHWTPRRTFHPAQTLLSLLHRSLSSSLFMFHLRSENFKHGLCARLKLLELLLCVWF